LAYQSVGRQKCFSCTVISKKPPIANNHLALLMQNWLTMFVASTNLFMALSKLLAHGLLDLHHILLLLALLLQSVTLPFLSSAVAPRLLTSFYMLTR
jgi:hypothetical protein